MISTLLSSSYHKENLYVSYGYLVGGIHKVMYHVASAFNNRDSVVLAFDGRNNFRKKLMPEYKIGRTSNTAVISQAELLYENLPRAGITCYKFDGYEGDDVINWCCKQATGYNTVYIYGKTVRLGLKNQFKTDANGNKILVPDADPAVKQQYQDYLAKKEGVKCPPLKFFMREHALNFRQSKPGKIIGMIIGTPVTVDKIDFNDIMAGKADFVREDNPELTTKVLGIEYAYIYLVGNYDGRIMESNAVLGAAASWINVKGVVDTKAFEKTKEYKLRYSLKLEAASKARKSLLIDGNYIPAKLYKSVAASAITAANAQGLNNSVLAIFKDGTGNVQDTVKALQTNVGKIVQSLGILYKWWVIAIVVIINILVLLSLRGARQTVIVQAPQSVQGTSVQPKTLPCESTQPQLEKSDEMKIF